MDKDGGLIGDVGWRPWEIPIGKRLSDIRLTVGGGDNVK